MLVALFLEHLSKQSSCPHLVWSNNAIQKLYVHTPPQWCMTPFPQRYFSVYGLIINTIFTWRRRTRERSVHAAVAGELVNIVSMLWRGLLGGGVHTAAADAFVLGSTGVVFPP